MNIIQNVTQHLDKDITLDKRQASDCNACPSYFSDWDFQVILMETDAYNPVTCGYGPENCIDYYAVSAESGWGIECLSTSSYTPNNGIGEDWCTGNQYVGTDPWSGDWMYVASCDNDYDPKYMWLNYWDGSGAAYCVWDPVNDYCQDDGYALETWTMSTVLQCQHWPGSDSEIMQVNWYWDQWWSDYAASLVLHGWDNGVCYQYEIAGAGSFNIANCYYEDSCECVFSTGDWCYNGNWVSVVGDLWGANTGSNTATTYEEPTYLVCWINYP